MYRTLPAAMLLSLILAAPGAEAEQGNTQIPAPANVAAAVASTRRVISLEEAIKESQLKGDDMKIVKGNLDAARAQHAFNLSKSGFSLSATGSGSVVGGTGDASLLRSLGSGASLGISENIQGSLSLSQGNASVSNPATKITLAATQNFPAQPEPPAAAVPASTIVAVSVSQSLWDGYAGGQTRAVLDKSILVYNGKELAASLARSSAIARVKQAYVTTLSAQRNQSLRRGLVAKQQALLRQVEAMHSLKQASLIDLMTARINVRSAELDLETTTHDLSLSRQRLSVLMNQSPDADYDVAETETPGLPAPNAEAAILIGLARRSDAAQLDLSRKQAAIDLALAEGLAQPGLTLSGGMNMGLSWDGSSTKAESANMGLRVTLPILDAGAAKAQADAVRSQMAVYDAQYTQLGKTITADIRSYYWLASIQLERVGLARQNADMLETQLSLVKVQNEYGTATTQDLLTAATNSANAEAAWAQARASYLLAVLALETAMGL